MGKIVVEWHEKYNDKKSIVIKKKKDATMALKSIMRTVTSKIKGKKSKINSVRFKLEKHLLTQIKRIKGILDEMKERLLSTNDDSSHRGKLLNFVRKIIL